MNGVRQVGWFGSLKTGAFFGLLGSLALVILEAGYFLLGPQRRLFLGPAEYGLFIVYLTGLILFWGIIVGLLEGTLSRLIFLLPPGRKRFQPGAFFLTATYLLGLYYYILARNAVLANLNHPEEARFYRQAFAFTTLLCLALAVPLYSLQKQRRRLAAGAEINNKDSASVRFGQLAAGGVLLIVLYLIGAVCYAREYPYIHNMFVLAVFWLGQFTLISLAAEMPPVLRRSLKKVFLLGGTPVFLAILAFTLFGFDANQNVKRVSLLETPVLSKAIQWTQRLGDFDRDGYSPILGGGDCDDFNPAINPEAYDIPGDGIDQDCFGGPRRVRPDREIARAGPVPGVENIVFITIDAARPDHLSCYGYGRETTPHLDRLAAEAVRFTEVYSQSSNSIFSLNSLMTALIPLEAEREEITPTLPEILEEAGWLTAVIGPRINFQAYDQRHLFYRGFRHRELSVIPPPFTDQPTTNALTEQALKFLRRDHQSPFFLWLHYYDPHAPYLPNPEGPDWGQRPIDRYDGEIFRADAGLGTILEELRRSGLYDRSLIAVFADHGEEFGEHGGTSHGPTLYNEVIRVPLVIRVPGAEPGTAATTVGLMDLFPTVLDVLGLPFPARIRGLSLLPALLGFEMEEREEGIFAENLIHRKRALIHGGWKMIYDYRYVTFELYNLLEDPGETRNLFDREPEKAAEMKSRLAEYY